MMLALVSYVEDLLQILRIFYGILADFLVLLTKIFKILVLDVFYLLSNLMREGVKLL